MNVHEVMRLTYSDYETGEEITVDVDMPPIEWWRSLHTGATITFQVTSVAHRGPSVRR